MRFRRLVTIMLTLSVVASLMALPVAAIDYSDVVAPLYIGLEDVTADLAISSNGYADCSGAAYWELISPWRGGASTRNYVKLRIIPLMCRTEL